jgi:hypothetical protein
MNPPAAVTLRVVRGQAEAARGPGAGPVAGVAVKPLFSAQIAAWVRLLTSILRSSVLIFPRFGGHRC